jgi:hypothetical protein
MSHLPHTQFFFFLQVGYSCNGCNNACGVFTTASGTLSDGASLYPANAMCTWYIAPVGATQIALDFTEFQTEQCWDVVKVSQCTDVDCRSQQLLATLTGYYTTSQRVISATGYMLVNFTSDSIISDSGFTASWSLNTGQVCSLFNHS